FAIAGRVDVDGPKAVVEVVDHGRPRHRSVNAGAGAVDQQQRRSGSSAVDEIGRNAVELDQCPLAHRNLLGPGPERAPWGLTGPAEKYRRLIVGRDILRQ